MGPSQWIALITAVLQFPGEMLKFAQLFKGTRQENRQALMGAIQAQADQFANTGRPDWNG